MATYAESQAASSSNSSSSSSPVTIHYEQTPTGQYRAVTKTQAGVTTKIGTATGRTVSGGGPRVEKTSDYLARTGQLPLTRAEYIARAGRGEPAPKWAEKEAGRREQLTIKGRTEAATRAEKELAKKDSTKFYKITDTKDKKTRVRYLEKDKYKRDIDTGEGVVTYTSTEPSQKKILTGRTAFAKQYGEAIFGRVKEERGGTELRMPDAKVGTVGREFYVVPKSATIHKEFVPHLQRQVVREKIRKEREKKAPPKEAAIISLERTGAKFKKHKEGLEVDIGGGRKQIIAFQRRDLGRGTEVMADIPVSSTYQRLKSYEQRQPRTFFETIGQKTIKGKRVSDILAPTGMITTPIKETYKDVMKTEFMRGTKRKVKKELKTAFESYKKDERKLSFEVQKYLPGWQRLQRKYDVEGKIKTTSKTLQKIQLGGFYKRTVGEDTGKVLIEERAEFGVGFVKGGYTGLREEPLKTTAYAGAAYLLTGGVAPAVSGLTAKAITKQAPKMFRSVTKGLILSRKVAGATFKYGVPAAYVGVKGLEIYRDPTPRGKGFIAGESVTTEILPTLVGGYAGLRFGSKKIQRFSIEEEALLGVTGSRKSLELAKEMRIAAKIVVKYKIPESKLKPYEAPPSIKEGPVVEYFTTLKGRTIMGSGSQATEMGAVKWYEPGTIKYSHKTKSFTGEERIVKDVDIIAGKYETTGYLQKRFKLLTGEAADVHTYKEVKLFPSHYGVQKVPIKSTIAMQAQFGEKGKLFTQKLLAGEHLYRKFLGATTVGGKEKIGLPKLYRSGRDIPDFAAGIRQVAAEGVKSKWYLRTKSTDKKILLRQAERIEKLKLGAEDDFAVGLGKPKAEIQVDKWFEEIDVPFTKPVKTPGITATGKKKVAIDTSKEKMFEDGWQFGDKKIKTSFKPQKPFTPSPITKFKKSGIFKSDVTRVTSYKSPTKKSAITKIGSFKTTSFKSPKVTTPSYKTPSTKTPIKSYKRSYLKTPSYKSPSTSYYRGDTPPPPPPIFLDFDFPGGKRKKRKTSFEFGRQFKYQAGLKEIMTGVTAKKAPKGMFGGLFTGEQLRPVVGGRI